MSTPDQHTGSERETLREYLTRKLVAAEEHIARGAPADFRTSLHITPDELRALLAASPSEERAEPLRESIAKAGAAHCDAKERFRAESGIVTAQPNDYLLADRILDMLRAELAEERCESGCDAPVTHHDADGIPLCTPCWESLTAGSPPVQEGGERAATLEQDREDAERWRALMSSPRIRFIGGARLGQPDALLGIEFYGAFPAPETRQEGREHLIQYVEQRRALAPASPAEPRVIEDLSHTIHFADGMDDDSAEPCACGRREVHTPEQCGPSWGDAAASPSEVGQIGIGCNRAASPSVEPPQEERNGD